MEELAEEVEVPAASGLVIATPVSALRTYHRLSADQGPHNHLHFPELKKASLLPPIQTWRLGSDCSFQTTARLSVQRT